MPDQMPDQSESKLNRVLEAFRNTPLPEVPHFELPSTATTLEEGADDFFVITKHPVHRNSSWVQWGAIAASAAIIAITFSWFKHRGTNLKIEVTRPPLVKNIDLPVGLVSRSGIHAVRLVETARMRLSSDSQREFRPSLADLQREFQRPRRLIGQDRLEKLIALNLVQK